jgi:predicted helicase
MKPKFEVVNNHSFKNTPDFMEQLKAHDEKLRKAVGRYSDFSGFGFGERENGWETKTKAEAQKIAAAIRKLKMRAHIRKAVDW